METITYVVAYEDKSPPVTAGMEINGGELVGAYFGDALDDWENEKYGEEV